MYSGYQYSQLRSVGQLVGGSGVRYAASALLRAANPKDTIHCYIHGLRRPNGFKRGLLTRSAVRDAPKDKKNGSRREFFSVHVAGITNGAHRPIVRRFTEEGQTEVTSSEQCDYLLVFCPVASRVGTDINEALANIPAAKPVVLVVMHHTFNPQQFVAESSRLVENPNVLTVDCLFHQSELLSCDVNDKMWRDVYNFLEVSQPCCCQTCISWMKNKPTLVCLGFAIMLALVTSIVLFSVLVATHKPLP